MRAFPTSGRSVRPYRFLLRQGGLARLDAEMPGREPGIAAEDLGEVALGLEAHAAGDVHERQAVLAEQLLRALDAPRHHVGVWRAAGRLLEQAREMERAHVDGGSEALDAQRLPQVLLDEGQH